jgi:hypothetical protein
MESRSTIESSYTYMAESHFKGLCGGLLGGRWIAIQPRLSDESKCGDVDTHIM